MSVVRVTVANLTCEEAARLGQAAGLDGQVQAVTGFGAWGIEPGVAFEFGGGPDTARTVRAFVTPLLKTLGETAAYAVVDGRPCLWYADGRTSHLYADEPLTVWRNPAESEAYGLLLAAKRAGKASNPPADASQTPSWAGAPAYQAEAEDSAAFAADDVAPLEPRDAR